MSWNGFGGEERQFQGCRFSEAEWRRREEASRQEGLRLIYEAGQRLAISEERKKRIARGVATPQELWERIQELEEQERETEELFWKRRGEYGDLQRAKEEVEKTSRRACQEWKDYARNLQQRIDGLQQENRQLRQQFAESEDSYRNQIENLQGELEAAYYYAEQELQSNNQ